MRLGLMLLSIIQTHVVKLIIKLVAWSSWRRTALSNLLTDLS